VLGGAGEIAYEFYKGLIELNVDSEFWSSGNSDNNTSREKFFEPYVSRNRLVTFFQVCFMNRCTLKVIWRLYKKRPNIVWVNSIGNKISLCTILFARALGIKIFVTLHDFLPISPTKIGLSGYSSNQYLDLKRIKLEESLHTRLRRQILTFYINRANYICAVGPLQFEILKSFGVSVKKWVPNGVARCTHKTKDSQDTQKRSGILFAGRLHRKGLEYLIDGLLQSKSKRKLLLAGEIDLLDYAKTRLSDKDIHYYGTVSRQILHEIMHKVELVCVLSQYFDPYPTIGLEAIRHGAPVIVTKTNGICHLLRSTEDEFIHEIDQVPDLDKILKDTKNFAEVTSTISLKIPEPQDVVKSYLRLFATSV
jgi:glycosyltransferase involved in cell wall biosynthesis